MTTYRKDSTDMKRSPHEETVRQLKILNGQIHPGATLMWFLIKLAFLIVGGFVCLSLLIKH
jgi:hypothetical protein